MTFKDNDSITLWQCLTCVHRIDLSVCKAFPDGIPEEIVRERVVHDKPYPGDNGIQYEEREIEIRVIPEDF
jgi:hypothetical protein